MYSMLRNKHLQNEFEKATGFRLIDKFYTDSNDKKYKEWININRIIGEMYFEYLEQLELPVKSSTTAEVGKGQYDSIVLPYDTKIISNRFVENSEYKDRLITGSFFIDGIEPSLIIKESGFKYVEPISNDYIRTFMTQNFLVLDEITGWDYMHNSGKYDIIVGMYGKTSDLNAEEKIKMLEFLKNHLLTDSIIRVKTKGDIYMGVVASKRNKVLGKIKTDN